MNQYPYIIAPILGWLVAQSIKFALTLRKDGLQWGDAVQSGGMPSSHSAFMAALSTVIALQQGIGSVAFGIAFSLTAVIVYDAMGVRRTTGQQTEAIKELAKAAKHQLATKVTVSRGHTPAEVTVGGFIGIIIGLAVNAIL